MELGQLLLLAALAAAGTAVIELVVRRSDVGAALVMGQLLFESFFPHLTQSLFLGPVRVGTADLLLVVHLTAAVARLLRVQRFTTAQRLMTAFGFLVAWSIVRGAGPFGIESAINEARSYMRFMAAALYFSTVEPRKYLFDRIARMWLAAAVALAVLAMARWGAYAAGISYGTLASATGTARVLVAAEALVIVVGAFIAFPMLMDRERGISRYLAPALMVVVILLQHRSVWVVAAAGTVYLLYRERAIAKRMLAALAAAVAIFGLVVVTVFPEQDSDVSEQLTRSVQSTGTWEWRVQGWQALMRESGPEGPGELLVGRPFATGFERQLVPGGPIVDVSPHNHYLRTLLRVGVIGLAVLLALYAIGLQATLRAARLNLMRDWTLPPIVLHIIIAVHLVYFIPYSIPPEQGVLLGLAVAVAAVVTSDRPRSKLQATS